MTNIKELITRPVSRFIASQLRNPHGFLASRVGKEMNLSNSAVYDLTLASIFPSDGDSILEIGFGNGKFFPDLFAKADGLSVYGVERSAKMVATARSSNPDVTASGELDLYLGSSDKMIFWNDTFDHVFCINVIYFWDSPDAHLQEIHRVLKPGGRFYTGIKSKETLSAMAFTKHGFNLYSDSEWVNVLEDNHFSVVDVVAKKSTDINADALCIIAEKQ